MDTANSTSMNDKELIEGIKKLKKEKNAVIYAHFYQEGTIQDLADYVADSLGLARKGAEESADIILLAGVLFMGETAKILSPEKKVLVPDMDAGCSLADNCPPDEFAAFKKAHPDHYVVSYVNCSAEVKALSDILCTSSNAVSVIESIPKDQKIIFAPDKHLGNYLIKKTGREMVLWDGACIVHETFDAKKIVQLKAKNPEAIIIAHPECPENVLAVAEHIGSTSSLLNFTKDSDAKEFIVVTEAGIIHQMKKSSPNKIFHAVANSDTCNCAECPFMRLNTLQKIYNALRDEKPEVIIEPELIKKAVLPLEKMLAIS